MYIYKFIRSLIYFIRYHRILNKAYDQDKIIMKISHIFGTQFRVDWINRIYGVVNPEIRDGKYNPDQVWEYTESGKDNSLWIEKYIMDHMNIMRKFITTENLFEVLTFDIVRLDNLNYLFILEPVTWKPLKKNSLYALIELAFIIYIIFYGIT